MHTLILKFDSFDPWRPNSPSHTDNGVSLQIILLATGEEYFLFYGNWDILQGSHIFTYAKEC